MCSFNFILVVFSVCFGKFSWYSNETDNFLAHFVRENWALLSNTD